MVTYRQISKLRKHVKVNQHAVDQYQARVDHSINVEGAQQKLINAYLRGDPLTLSVKRRLKQAFRYLESADYYKYGDLVVVVKESGPRYQDFDKEILTCYRYRNSKFDPEVVRCEDGGMADTRALGARAERRGGSSPPPRTKFQNGG